MDETCNTHLKLWCATRYHGTLREAAVSIILKWTICVSGLN